MNWPVDMTNDDVRISNVADLNCIVGKFERYWSNITSSEWEIIHEIKYIFLLKSTAKTKTSMRFNADLQYFKNINPYPANVERE
jgi:hypothetical protein